MNNSSTNELESVRNVIVENTIKATKFVDNVLTGESENKNNNTI